MQAQLLRRLAAGACLAMAVLLVLFQTVLTPATEAPLPLFLLFVGLWTFGFAMLLVAPLFGAWGTAAWGVVSAIGAWRTHAGMAGEDVVLIAGSLLASSLAVAFLVLERAARRVA